jgi:hypothetical protein
MKIYKRYIIKCIETETTIIIELTSIDKVKGFIKNNLDNTKNYDISIDNN